MPKAPWPAGPRDEHRDLDADDAQRAPMQRAATGRAPLLPPGPSGPPRREERAPVPAPAELAPIGFHVQTVAVEARAASG